MPSRFMPPASGPARQPTLFRLVVLDLDGTLLDPAAQISPGNAAAVRACLRVGVHVALATGKLYASVVPMVAALRLGGPQILNNGAVIIDASDEAVLQAVGLPPGAAPAVMRALLALGLPVAAYTPHAIYSPTADPRLDLIVAIHEPQPVVLPDVAEREGVDDWAFVKILTVLEADDPATPALEAALHAQFADTLTVVRTSAHFYEFLAPGVDKGASLRRVAGWLGVPLTATLAIGDNYNDLPLLAAAGLGVAMGNAPPAVQLMAGAITADHAHDGVALALRRYVLRVV